MTRSEAIFHEIYVPESNEYNDFDPYEFEDFEDDYANELDMEGNPIERYPFDFDDLEDDSEDLEIEIDEYLEPESETAAQTRKETKTMPAYIYDYKTIETALDLEDILLFKNPNATFTAKQTNLIRDAINNTVNPDCDLFCRSLEIKDGQFFPEFCTNARYKRSYIDLGQREDRASYLAEQAEGQAFDSIDEIRIYMNDGLDTPLLEEIMADYEESQPEEIDLEGAEIEIDEDLEIEYETAAQTATEPQTDVKTERKGVKTMIKNTINKAKNLFNKLKPTTTERILDQGSIIGDQEYPCQFVQIQKGKKLEYVIKRIVDDGHDGTKQRIQKQHNFETAVKNWGYLRTWFD